MHCNFWNLFQFYSKTIKPIPNAPPENTNSISKLKAKRALDTFRSGLLAYILAVRLILESILARQTTPRCNWGKISLKNFLIINAPPELKTTENFL